MSNPQVPIEGRYELGDFELQSGKVLPGAHIGYATWGSLNAAGDNAIVYPTWYSGQHQSNAPFIGKGMALDPDRYFIVVPDMFTNGLSTSPSNCAPPHAGMDFPLVTPYDNVVAQHRLLTENLGGRHWDCHKVVRRRSLCWRPLFRTLTSSTLAEDSRTRWGYCQCPRMQQGRICRLAARCLFCFS